jgi:hypothetical protein
MSINNARKDMTGRIQIEIRNQQPFFWVLIFHFIP